MRSCWTDLPVARRPPQRPSHRAPALAVLAVVATRIGSLGCGGTSGREDLPAAQAPSSKSDATVSGDDDAGGDATVDAAGDGGGSGLDDPFDVVIQYADRPLPDVQLPTDGEASETGTGTDAGSDSSAWPPCAPDIPERGTEFPAIFSDDGGQALAPDGSVCATHVWVGSSLCDRCLRIEAANASWFGAAGPVELPPCSDLAGAGVAAVGPGAGVPRIELCEELFTCILTSGCFETGNDVAGCMCKGTDTSHCNSTGGDGVCFAQEQAAMEIPNTSPGAVYTQITLQMTAISASAAVPGHGATSVNQMFNDALLICTAQCTQADAGSN